MGRASDPTQVREEGKYDASLRAAERLLKQAGKRLEQLDRWIEDPPDGETFITEIRIKVGGGWDGGCLAILKKEGSAGRQIAFHGADTLMEAVTGLVSRLDNGSLKWKEDVGYEPKSD